MEESFEKLDSSIHDIKIYSEGLITAIENKNFKEIDSYSKKMQVLLEEVLKLSDIQQSQLKNKMKFPK